MTDVWDTIPVYQEDPIELYSVEQAIEWLKEEEQAWDWLWSGGQSETVANPSDFAGFGNRIRQMISALENNPNIAPSHQAYAGQKQSTYAGSQGNMIVSSSRAGEDILAIKERVGEQEARVAFKAHMGQLQLNSIKSAADLRGAMLFASPEFVDPLSYTDDLKSERTRYRSEITKLQNRTRSLEQEKRNREARRGRQMRRVVRRFRNVIKERADGMLKSVATQASETNARLLETEDRFRKQMELQAPVEYWKMKSKIHGRWEIGFAVLSIAYFFAAAYCLYLAATKAASYLLSLPDIVDPSDDRTPIYIITGGALLGVTTLIFWVGRLVIKLWLSEHHLRVDADERAVMTKTYLAMTENGSALDEDRAIVLTSIFRPTPDGVVKEEGPTDVGLNAYLARIASKNS